MKTRRETMERYIEEGKAFKGTIDGFRGSWMSGLGTLIISGQHVPCENAATVRALDACFGDVIAPGHSVNQEAIVGREVYWNYDETGIILGWFTPTEGDSWDTEWEEEE